MARVRVTGELDIATAPILEHTLRAAEQRAARIVLDLRELAFMDSCGVHVILDAAARMSADRGRLVLVCGPARSTACSNSPPPQTTWTSSTSTRSNHPSKPSSNSRNNNAQRAALARPPVPRRAERQHVAPELMQA